MESTGEPEQDQRHRAINELRSRKVGILLQIIDALADMNLSIVEIETVLRTCGMNDECAIRFGATMKAEKEEKNIHPNRPIHP